jgi:hypothetical protein
MREPLTSENGTNKPVRSEIWTWLWHFQAKVIEVVFVSLGSGSNRGDY